MRKFDELLQDIQDMCPDYYNNNYNFLHNIKDSLIKEQDEFAIDFAEWQYDFLSNRKIIFENYTKTTQELLQKFKKEKGL